MLCLCYIDAVLDKLFIFFRSDIKPGRFVSVQLPEGKKFKSFVAEVANFQLMLSYLLSLLLVYSLIIVI